MTSFLLQRLNHLTLVLFLAAASVKAFVLPRVSIHYNHHHPKAPHQHPHSTQQSTAPSPIKTFSPSTALFVCSVHRERRGFEIPLLDLLHLQDDPQVAPLVQPLPSTHLPDELTTLNVYGMEVTLPLHQAIVDYTLQRQVPREFDGQEEEPTLGQLAYKSDSSNNNDDTAGSPYIGAIGCAAQIIVPPDAFSFEEEDSPLTASATSPTTTPPILQRLVCRGSYRFIVRELKQSLPFPVAIVDELLDDPIPHGDLQKPIGQRNEDTLEDDDEDFDDEEDFLDDYSDLTPIQLEQRLLQAMQDHVDQQLALVEQDMSPLEKSLIEENTGGVNVQKQAAEEMAAVFSVFQQYLVDLCPNPTERFFATAFMAAEMANMNNHLRRQILQTTNSVERLAKVLRQLENKNGMTRARKMANAISDSQTSDSDKDLQVGEPELPPWAKSLTKGMVIEYFWNEEFEWCQGTVVEDPVKIVDELIVTVRFDDDGSTHKLPFRADEKARWRPARGDS